MAQRGWRYAGVADRIELHVVDALDADQWLPDGPIDFAFVDGDKLQYRAYYEMLLPRLRQNGLVVIDNTLWWGSVVNPPARPPRHDRDAKVQ